MPERILSISEIIQQLPQKLQVRFNSLGKYVQGIIEESATIGKQIKLSSEDTQLIQLAALIYSLDSFLRAGSYAAKTAATTFEEFELGGFQVGSTLFTKNNENTRRGEILADKLRLTISQNRLGTLINSSSTMRELISKLVREMSHGETVD